VVARHCELIFCLLTSPKCDLNEVEKAMFQVVKWHFEVIFFFLTTRNCVFFKSLSDDSCGRMALKNQLFCLTPFHCTFHVTHTTGMPQFKIISASQSSIHIFTSLKRQIYNCNASIYFNKQCLIKKLTPTYANITIPNTSPAHKFTQQKVTTIRIKDEIKYLHSKKQKLNAQTYRLHLTLANNWNCLWQHIQHTIENKFQKEAQSRYRKLDTKLNKLEQLQRPPDQNKTSTPGLSTTRR